MHTTFIQSKHTSTVGGIYLIFNRSMNHLHTYIALFSASKQTSCALVACNSEWVTVALHGAVLISTEVVYLQCGMVVYSAMLAISAHVLYTPYSHAPVYSVTWCHMFIWSLSVWWVILAFHIPRSTSKTTINPHNLTSSSIYTFHFCSTCLV